MRESDVFTTPPLPMPLLLGAPSAPSRWGQLPPIISVAISSTSASKRSKYVHFSLPIPTAEGEALEDEAAAMAAAAAAAVAEEEEGPSSLNSPMAAVTSRASPTS